jgi:hypothetical protein
MIQIKFSKSDIFIKNKSLNNNHPPELKINMIKY